MLGCFISNKTNLNKKYCIFSKTNTRNLLPESKLIKADTHIKKTKCERCVIGNRMKFNQSKNIQEYNVNMLKPQISQKTHLKWIIVCFQRHSTTEILKYPPFISQRYFKEVKQFKHPKEMF